MKRLFLLLPSLFIWANGFSQKALEQNQSHVITCTDFHVTRPLSEIAEEQPYVQQKFKKEIKNESGDRAHRHPQTFLFSAADGAQYGEDQSVRQTSMGTREGNRAPLKNFPGQSTTGFRPFDPSGAAGPNHYVQAINGTPFRVMNKTTGANLLTANIGSLWAPATPNDGDPIIMYDSYADRWFISQFGQTGNRIYIAISQTNNPMGAYYAYTFTSPEFPDYLKFSIWADGYYMTSNQGTDKVFCFERDQMLLGNAAARAVYSNFTTGSTGGFFVPLPADAEGGLPTVGTPCPFFAYYDNAWGGGADGVKIWNMTVNWGGTPSLNVVLNTTVPTAAFDASYDAGWNDISQPGTAQKLDGIGGVPTYRAQWRKWTGYNSLVMNWGVRISATQRSIRWVELRQNQTTGVWSLYQEGTFSPDTDSRWLGSIAMDNNGSIALCYAKSSTTVYPSLGYTGRLATDPLGTMTFAETIAIAGSSSQTGTNRFGDYSQTSLDPDGITFWHTGEYLGTGGNVLTRVYSFQLPAGPTAPVANFSADNTTPCIGSTVTFTDQSSGSPTSWAWTFSPTTVTYVGGTTSASQNPQVQFNAAGPYTVTLLATNGLGNDSEIKTNYIVPISPGTLPLVENFEGATFPPTGWTINNPDGGAVAWGTAGAKTFVRRAAAGNTGSATGSAGIECFNYNTDTTQVDELISRPISLSGATSPRMTFKRSYKYYGAPYMEELRVFISSNCGTSFGPAVYYKKGTQLATNGTLTTTFTPAVAADWDIDTVDLSSYIGQNIIVKFQVTNKYGNNLYIDDININNTAGAVAGVSITSNDVDNTICAGQSVTFTATPTNGGTTPSYQWKVNGVNAGTNSPTFTTTTLTNGQIVTCVMTSNLAGVTGNPATSNAITMVVNAIPATPTASSNTPVCTGGTINLATPTVAGATYAWTGPSTFTSAVQNPTRPTATTAMAGTYSVTVTTNGCTSLAGTTAVVVNTTPATPTASSNTPVCAGSTINLTTPAVTGATYAWTGPSAFTSAVQNPTRPTSTVAMAGTYSLTVTVGGCTSSVGTTAVVVNARPATPTASSNTPVCTGNTINLATPTVAGATYAWTGPSTFTSTTQNPTRPSATTAMAGTYSVTVTTNGCTSLAGTTAVVVNTTPATPTASSNTPVCAGSTINLTTPNVGGATYAWTGPSAFTAAVRNPNRPSSTVAMSGTYSVTVTSNGCTSAPGTTVVVVNPALTPSLNVSITAGGNPTCNGQSVTFTATPTNGGASPTYQWQVNGGNAGTGAAFTSSALNNGDVVTCILTSNALCVSPTTATSTAITMSVTSTVTPSVSISGTSTICSGASTTFTAAPTNGGTSPTYQWQVNATNVGTGSTFTSSSLVNGDIVTCIMTSSSSCASPTTATSPATTILVTPTVTPSVSITGTATICIGDATTFTATPTNGGTTPTYQWQVNAANAGTGSTFTSSTLANGDVVTCIMTSNLACASPTTATSGATTMVVNGIPSTPTITQNGNVLTSSSAVDNQWYFNGSIIPGATNQDYTATQDGTYTVVVTTNGCSSASSAGLPVTVTGISESMNGFVFDVYPNPNDGNFNLSFTAVEKSNYTIEIYNAIGQRVYSEGLNEFQGNYNKKMSVVEYGRGVYTISLINSKSHMTVKKMVVY